MWILPIDRAAYEALTLRKLKHFMSLPDSIKNSTSATSNPETVSAVEANHSDSDTAKFFLASIVESSPYSIITVDFDGVITTWNKGAEQIYGYSAEEAVGQQLLRLVLPNDAAKVLSNIEKVKLSEEAPDLDSFRIKKGGEEIHVEVVMAPVKDDQGKVIGVSTISHDVTQQRHMEEKLQRAHQELENRVQERTQQLQEEVQQRRLLEEQRTQLMQRVLKAQEEERARVARELHDNLGQHLTAILLHIRKLESESLQTQGGHLLLEEQRASMKGLGHLSSMVNDLTATAHRLAWELRPAVLDNFGLIKALEGYVQTWSEQGITAQFISSIRENETNFSGSIETALYRVVQEALTNVQRHAHASQVSIILERQQQFVTLIVEDNGRGFDVQAAQESNRLGLIGMRERLELIGGTLGVESEPWWWNDDICPCATG
jgi:PAS domain S-box-containing protein